MKKSIKEKMEYVKPVVVAGANLATLGFAGAIVEILQLPHEQRQKKKIMEFIKRTKPKLKLLEKMGSRVEFYKRVKSDEFYQAIIEIIRKIQTETREKIIEAYSNILKNLLSEDLKINFNKKLFFIRVLGTLNEDHLKLICLFYEDKHVIKRFKLHDIHKKMGCIEYRYPISKDESKSISGKRGNFLNKTKSSYVNSLLADLIAKEVIKKEQEVTTEVSFDEVNKEIDRADSEIEEEYIGTEIGRAFFNFLK